MLVQFPAHIHQGLVCLPGLGQLLQEGSDRVTPCVAVQAHEGGLHSLLCALLRCEACPLVFPVLCGVPGVYQVAFRLPKPIRVSCRHVCLPSEPHLCCLHCRTQKGNKQVNQQRKSFVALRRA